MTTKEIERMYELAKKNPDQELAQLVFKIVQELRDDAMNDYLRG